MNSKNFKNIILLVVVFSATACYKKLEDFELGEVKWSPELAIPLINSSFTMEDFLTTLDSNNFVSEESGVVLVSYTEDSLMSSQATSFFQVDDQSFPKVSLHLTPDEVNTFNTTGSVTVIRDIPASLINEQKAFDSIWVQTGAIDFDLTEDFPANGTLNISLPGFSKRSNSAEIIRENYAWNYDGITATTGHTASHDLDGYLVNFNGTNDVNEIYITIELKLDKIDDFQVDLNNSLDLQLSLRNIEFDALFGNLGSKPIETDVNEIPIDLFKGIETVGFALEDPRLSLFLTNGLGLPARFDISETYAVKGDNRLKLNIAQPNIDIEGPATIGEGANESAIPLDEAFKELINKAPDAMEFQIQGMLNPDGTGPNFVTRNSRIQVGAEVQIPLYGSVKGLSFKERFDFDGSDIEGSDRALFRIKTVNAFPMDAQLRAYFLNENGERIQTLVGEGFYFLTAANADKNGDSATNTLEILLEDDDLATLDETTQIEVVVTLNTLNADDKQAVKISSSSAIDIAVGAQINFEIDL